MPPRVAPPLAGAPSPATTWMSMPLASRLSRATNDPCTSCPHRDSREAPITICVACVLRADVDERHHRVVADHLASGAAERLEQRELLQQRVARVPSRASAADTCTPISSPPTRPGDARRPAHHGVGRRAPR